MEDKKPNIEEGASLEGDQSQNTPDEGASLESTQTEDGASLENDSATDNQSQSDNPDIGSLNVKNPKPKSKKPKKLSARFARINIYFTGFILILIIALMVLFIGIQRAQKETSTSKLTTQTLSPDDINKISGNDVTVGSSDQTLKIESNTIIAGALLVQGGLDIAGSIKVGGTLSLANLNVTGSAKIPDAQLDKLAVTGDASVQGGLAVQQSLNVSGGGSFGGNVTAPQITVNTLQLNGDLALSRHIDAGGATPSRSTGSVGSGGTTSNSGTDTAGSVNINTGSGPGSCLVTITFSVPFSGTPHVVITPTTANASSLNYYVQRNTTSFTICGSNTASSRVYGFDYIVID